jgi:lysozyme
MTRVQRIATGVAAALGLSLGTASVLVGDWIADEGWRLQVYRDSAGIPTVCAGHTGPDVRMGDRWTEDECIGITVHDIVRHCGPVMQRLVDPTPGEVVAWCNFAGNAGVQAFIQSTGLRLQQAGQRVAACEQLLRWVYITVDGRKLDCRDPKNNCRGLPDRRDRQMARCLSDGTVLASFEVRQ